MDPQKLSKLDPKLKDAYERVMGGITTEPQTFAPSNLPPIQPQASSIIPPQPIIVPTPQPTSDFAQQMNPKINALLDIPPEKSSNIKDLPAPFRKPHEIKNDKKGKIISIFYILLILIIVVATIIILWKEIITSA
jgi:hypothetical protein